MLFEVMWNNKPASIKGFPSLKGKGWEKHTFASFEEACEYAEDWLDFSMGGLPADFMVNTVYPYGDNTLEIRVMN